MTQAQVLANLSQDYGVIPMSNRNLFIDGALDQFSSNAAVALQQGSNYGALLAWRVMCGLGGAGTLQIGGGGGSVVSVPYNYAVWTQSTGSTGTVSGSQAPGIYQTLENVATLAGKSLTFSVTLQLASGGPLVIPAILCRQYFGSGGSPSALVTLDKAVNWVVTNTVKRFSVRLDLPSVQGMNRGSNWNDGVQLGLWLPPSATFVMTMQQFQCEQSNPLSSSDINGNGGAPTAFEYRGYSLEQARLLRFYQNIQNVVTATNQNYFQLPFIAAMRGTPALAMGAPSTGAIGSSGVSGTGVFFTLTGTYPFNSQVTATLDSRF